MTVTLTWGCRGAYEGLHKLDSMHGCMQGEERGEDECYGCFTVGGSLQSLCGKCKVWACPVCEAKWAKQRKRGIHAHDAGLVVHQANLCFCGSHLTPRGEALYNRKVWLLLQGLHIVLGLTIMSSLVRALCCCQSCWSLPQI